MLASSLVIGAGITAAAVALVACGGGSSGTAGNAPAGVAGPPSGTAIVITTTPRPTVVEPESMSATIAAVGESGAGGTASATKEGAGSSIVVEATGLAPGTHAVYLKAGGCEGSGQRFGPLTELESGADGSAEGTTPLPAARLGSLLEKQYHVVIYAGGNDAQGDVVACGELVPD